MRTPPIAAVLLVTTLVSGAPAAAAAPPAGDVLDLAHPSVRSFSDREGLPQNTVHSIARDAQGYLWVGTQDGAARWNGREWIVVDMPDRQVSNYVRTLLPARDGSTWFGREDGGVVRLRPGAFRAAPPAEAFTVYDAARGLPAPRVNHLSQTRSGTVWAATLGGGAARFDGERFVAVAEGLSDLRLWVVEEIEDDEGRLQLLAGGEGGLFALDGDRWKPSAPAALLPSVNSLAQTTDAGGRRTLWIGSYGGGVTRVRAGRVTRFGPGEGLASRLVTCLAVTRRAPGEEQVFAATRDDGLFALVGERFVRVPLRSSMSEVYWLHAGGDDDPGALWVGTRTAGLLRLEAASWLALDSTSGLPNDQVLGLLETREGPGGNPVYWIGTGNGIAVVRGDRLLVEGREQGLPGPQVLALAELRGRDRPPEIWASVVGLGLVRRSGGRWRRVDARPAFNADFGVWLLATTAADGAAVLWVGTERGGLARMERDAWTVIGTKDGLPSDHVVSLLETTVGGKRHLFVGTRGGGAAEIVDGRVVAKWDRASGLPNDDVLSLAEVRLPHGRRELWAGTRAGVARRGLEPGARWSRLVLPQTTARSSETVVSIGQDLADRVYLGTQRGVVRLTRTEGPAEEEPAFAAEVFGPGDGLPSPAANWGQLLDSRGRVWIATAAGVALLDPSREATFAAPPSPLVVERAEALATGRTIASGEVLRPRERDVAFEYALLTPRRGGEVRYRTQLVGHEAAASAWVGGHARTYTSLSPGRYTFRVEARDAAGLASGPVEVAFTVTEYPWLRPWAIGLQVGALVGLLVLVLRSREHRFRRRAASLEALVAERTRQLSEANALLAELSVTDPLTGLANRRALETRAEDEWRRGARAGSGITLVMVDVDHFKAYNDALGHLAGDECLRRVADSLRRLAKRPGDLAARYGGEEFACLLPGLDRQAACAHAERLREAIEELALPHPASPLGPVVTVSLGVAWSTPSGSPDGSWRVALAAADAALYRAKQNGRNRVEVAG